jgi:thiamine-phosphate pyrophosphorylase
MRQLIDYSLYLVTDRGLCGDTGVVETVLQAVAGGVRVVQLREKTLDTRRFIETATQLRKELAPLGVPLLINDRVDVALASGADGVHIGQSDMPYEQARAILGPQAIIGLSVETQEQVTEAKRLDVDYLGISPVFATTTKKDAAPPWGLEGVRRIRLVTNHILVGIGGIGADNAADVLMAGADGVAVVSAICGTSSPRAAAEALCRAIQR